MNYPLVSILIPIYNVEEYIEQCVRSVFGQTYENLEIIFVDDASPDNSVAIVEKVVKDYPNRKNRIYIIHNPSNKGLGFTRKIAIEAAHGEYIQHVDSDDFLELNMVEKLVTKALENDADIVVCGYEKFSDIKETEYHIPQFYKTKTEIVANVIEAQEYCWNWNKLVRRSLYSDLHIMPEEGIDLGEDIFLNYRLLYGTEKINIIPELLYHYRRNRKGSYTTNELTNKTSNCQCCLIENIRSFLQENNLYNDPCLKSALIHRELRTMIYIARSDSFPVLRNNKHAFNEVGYFDIIKRKQLETKTKLLALLAKSYIVLPSFLTPPIWFSITIINKHRKLKNN